MRRYVCTRHERRLTRCCGLPPIAPVGYVACDDVLENISMTCYYFKFLMGFTDQTYLICREVERSW